MNKIQVSVIIVNYNTKELTSNTIDSVYKKTKDITFEIIVVDNASIDSSVEFIENNHPEAKVIKCNENLGFGKANNLGIKIASGKYIFILNPDTILINNAIKILHDFLDYNIDVAAVCGNLFTANLKPAYSFSRIMPGVLNEIDVILFHSLSRIFYSNNSRFNNTQKPIKFKGTLSGADIMMRRDIFINLNGFDPDFFMYYEETELMHRVNRAGYKIASNPEAKIIHLEGASESVKYNTIKRSMTSKWIYFKKTNLEKLIPIIYIISQVGALQRYYLYTALKRTNKATYWKMIYKAQHETYNNFKSD